MSNHKACRVVWFAMTGLAIANLAGVQVAGPISIMLGGSALLYASLKRDADTVRVQRLTAFLALLLLGQIAQINHFAWTQLAVAGALLATGCLSNPAERKWHTDDARAVRRSVAGNAAVTWG